jgi:hypothetical protein
MTIRRVRSDAAGAVSSPDVPYRGLRPSDRRRGAVATMGSDFVLRSRRPARASAGHGDRASAPTQRKAHMPGTLLRGRPPRASDSARPDALWRHLRLPVCGGDTPPHRSLCRQETG